MAIGDRRRIIVKGLGTFDRIEGTIHFESAKNSIISLRDAKFLVLLTGYNGSRCRLLGTSNSMKPQYGSEGEFVVLYEFYIGGLHKFWSLKSIERLIERKGIMTETCVADCKTVTKRGKTYIKLPNPSGRYDTFEKVEGTLDFRKSKNDTPFRKYDIFFINSKSKKEELISYSRELDSVYGAAGESVVLYKNLSSKRKSFGNYYSEQHLNLYLPTIL